ncbi:MAG: ubiquinol-cytochrome c reductase iron-sulfur subunit [Anaerolineae bacterium]
MATATKGDRTSIAQPSVQEQSAPQVMVDAPSRREFMYYIWGASMALLLGQLTAGLLWFAFPRFKEGEFGGVFPFDPTALPEAGTPPEWVASGRFHVSNTENGLLALYGVCTHLGCLPKWVPSNDRFECPCHGSKFEGNGGYIEGPAPRGLDRFPVVVTYTDGTTVSTPSEGGPVVLEPNRTIASIEVDTGSRILGPSV